MPKWKVHNKWAEKMKISKDTSNFVNGLVDFPKDSQEFKDFCEKDPDARIFRRGRLTRGTIFCSILHDSGRNKEYARRIQLKFLSQKGNDYIRAYWLHQILDYVDWWVRNYPGGNLTTTDILGEKRLKKKIGDPENEELQFVVDFVNQNSEEIIEDIKRNF